MGNGDGTLFYPGQDAIYPDGNRGIAGPISSIRMKNWRRGTQDYEYLWLACSLGHGAEVEAIVAGRIPAVLSDAPDQELVQPWGGLGGLQAGNSRPHRRGLAKFTEISRYIRPQPIKIGYNKSSPILHPISGGK